MNAAAHSRRALAEFLRTHRRLLVITGAGCSTPSGIADYRDADGEWKYAAPIMAQDFVRDPASRRRYWARSMRGWPDFAAAKANPAHRALATMQRRGMLCGLITQNVDGLHQQAGHQEVIELHGNLRWVVCLGCGGRVARADVQVWLQSENPAVLEVAATPAPDGDAELGVDLAGVRVPSCVHCGSPLKPDVVFYGESVPTARVQQAYRLVDDADAVLVVGSSLMVYSSYRFMRRAYERGLPMVAVNQGKTRADDWLQIKVAEDCVAVLPDLLAALERG